MKFSIHTFQLHTIITMPQLKELCLELSVYGRPKVNRKPSYSYFSFPPVAQKSIWICAAAVFSELTRGCVCVHLNVIMNPRRALGLQHNAAAEIIDRNKLGDALYVLYSNLYELLPPAIIESLQLSRVDFTGDIRFPTQEQAEEYVNLFKKGHTARTLRESKVYDPTTNQDVSYEESWLLGCGSYSFQVYPKMLQMQKRRIPSAEAAKGIVRFELRANRTKLKALMKKHSVPAEATVADALVMLAQTVPETEIKKIAKAAVGSGDFYTLDRLKKIIDGTTYQKRVRDDRSQLSEHLSRYSGVERLLEEKLITSEEWRRQLQRFDTLGVSPIPVPARSCFRTAPGVGLWDEYQ